MHASLFILSTSLAFSASAYQAHRSAHAPFHGRDTGGDVGGSTAEAARISRGDTSSCAGSANCLKDLSTLHDDFFASGVSPPDATNSATAPSLAESLHELIRRITTFLNRRPTSLPSGGPPRAMTPTAGVNFPNFGYSYDSFPYNPASSRRTSQSVASSISRSVATSKVATASPVTTASTNGQPSKTATAASCVSSSPPPEGVLPNCIRCQGQPGTDEFCGLTVDTDYHKAIPKTCRVRHFEVTLTQITGAPDGVPRIMQVINGQYPGPLIRGSWGDTIVVTVHNNLPDDSNNGTTIHFHGVSFRHNNMMDGVPSITQCPIAPGKSMTYTWVAEHYGTSWYHAHISVQAWMGVAGPMIIDGPSTAKYDFDLGTVMLTDWSHRTVDELYDNLLHPVIAPTTNGSRNGQPTLDNGLINGKNVWIKPDGSVVGSRYMFENIEPGKRYRLRLINVAIQSPLKFHIDGHNLQVIATDWTPIEPYKTDMVITNSGQRYDVIVTANAKPGAYWMRVDNMDTCARILQGRDIKAVFAYKGCSDITPTSQGRPVTEECVDEPRESLIPHVKVNAGPADVVEGSLDAVANDNEAHLVKWFLSGTTFFSDWSDPPLLHVWDNTTIINRSGRLTVDLPKRNTTVYLIIESKFPLPHPIHVHGHDVFLLAQGQGPYSSGDPLQLNNPPRRDTVTLPPTGHVVLAWVTDNPGIWAAHCHLGFHVAMGFALEFREMVDQIVSSGAISDSCTLVNTCRDWRAYAQRRGIVTIDSGL